MKLVFLSCALLLSFVARANEDICTQTFRGTTEVLRSYTETVSQCLNRYDDEGNLAGKYDELVNRFSSYCIQSCDSERARLCEKMKAAKDRLKAASPWECTR